MCVCVSGCVCVYVNVVMKEIIFKQVKKDSHIYLQMLAVRGVVHPTLDKDEKYKGYSLRKSELVLAIKLWKGKPVYLNHDYSQPPCGTVNSLRQGLNGELVADLEVDTKTKTGALVLDGLNEGRYRGLSLGYSGMLRDKTKVSTIKPIEISICEKGAMPDTEITMFAQQGRLVYFKAAFENYYLKSQIPVHKTFSQNSAATAKNQKMSADEEVIRPLAQELAAEKSNDASASGNVVTDPDKLAKLEKLQLYLNSRGITEDMVTNQLDQIMQDEAKKKDEAKKRRIDLITNPQSGIVGAIAKYGKVAGISNDTDDLFNTLYNSPIQLIELMAATTGNWQESEQQRLAAEDARKRDNMTKDQRIAELEAQLQNKKKVGLADEDERFYKQKFQQQLETVMMQNAMPTGGGRTMPAAVAPAMGMNMAPAVMHQQQLAAPVVHQEHMVAGVDLKRLRAKLEASNSMHIPMKKD